MKNFSLNNYTSIPACIWGLFLGTFVTRSTSMMVWPFISIILYTKFNFTASMIGLVLSLSIAISSILSFYAGYFSDKVGRAKIIVIGCLISSLAYLILWLSEHQSGFIIGTLLANISWALVNNPIKAVIGDIIEEKQVRENAMYLRYLFLNAGAVVGPYLGIKLSLDINSISFLIVSVSYVIFMIPVYLFGKKIKINLTNNDDFKGTIKVLLNDRVFLMLVINNILMMFVFGHFDSTLPQLITSLGFNGYTEFIASLIMLHAITIVVMQLPFSMLTQKMELETKINIGSVLLILSELMFFISFKYYDVYLLWYIAAFTMSISQTILFPCVNVFIDRLAPNDLRGAYFGAASLYSIGFSISPLVGGTIIQLFNGGVLFQLLAILSVLMLVIFCRMFKLRDKHEINIRRSLKS
ncbi:MFS transporter [Photorhabdus luminescens subsp. luminescens]|uniref:Predicted arabinose efflux permease, MFS family n=1 Tax=Photorhabdus luminescens TaxID=29488 RepID=A0A1G5R3E0_PHOLU|nr:MFS transporter [Photorhabdus luminescens]KMW72852.1 MFS transporter [Photorhabdus luminescens subsp. luminescens]SCZ68583.1 Predicted arabinose efflux permease, MFS family [Photorhabdus luminescens]